ncbi:MAG: Hsp20/alpha crystallin family protein [Roseovarius sp.]
MARNYPTRLSPRPAMIPMDPLTSLHRELNRMFADVYGGDLPSAAAGAVPGASDMLNAELNVSETEKEFRVTADLPGVHPDDLDIRLDNDLLTIRGEKKYARTEGEDKENYHLVERAYGTFQRSLRLPGPVDADGISANYDSGVLNIKLPKTSDGETARRIQVQPGSPSQLGSNGGQKKSEGDGEQTAKSG